VDTRVDGGPEEPAGADDARAPPAAGAPCPLRSAPPLDDVWDELTALLAARPPLGAPSLSKADRAAFDKRARALYAHLPPGAAL